MMTSIAHTVKTNPSLYQVDRGYIPKNPIPLPPFGKEAELLISWEVKPRNDIFIFAGLDGWRKAKSFKDTQIVMVLPYGEAPENYTWPVQGCSILLVDTGFLSVLDIEKIAYCLLCANAAIVRAILSSNKVVIYRRSAA